MAEEGEEREEEEEDDKFAKREDEKSERSQRKIDDRERRTEGASSGIMDEGPQREAEESGVTPTKMSMEASTEVH